ncbi:FHIP family protein GF15501 isoform X1 [Helicoverpa armigera]|uniref:FHIP family protein GF15501 isoform X1 n=1 Tax=Helicoverpa armigera TaxID=29058 RepID=UPI0030835FB8
MSWLRTTGLSFARQLSRSLDPRHDYEPQACYNSFCKHWQQAHDIIQKSQPNHLHDDVLGVVNHLEQLATLLVLEARAREINTATSPAACLEYLLSENLLDKLYEWAVCTGKYENAVRLEQLKLFGNLISHYSAQVIAAEPFLRPLLKLLSGFRNELPPPNLESQLVSVLNQLCVALMQNMKFLDLFFLTTHTHKGSQAEFIIVRLLLASVHREGSTGSAARDALLLCAKMSARCPQLADFMLSGNTCPVLATGLSGLYSLLPRTLNDKIYRLTPDDVNHVHKLTLFIDSLEFCNAVAQVAHPSIKKHLLDLLYQGFLVPVMGPALLQTKAPRLQSGAAEQAAAMAYLELLLRCVSRAGLLRAVLHFLVVYEYDGVRVVDVLLRRLEGNSQLSLVSLALMETLIDLNCEDVMLDLVFRHLLNGHHLMVAYRHKIADPEPYRDAAVAFLGLSPRCCARPMEMTKQWIEELALTGRRVLDLRSEAERRVNGVHDDIAMSHFVHELKVNYGNPNDTLYGNFHAYICDSRFEIVSRVLSCTNWTSRYDSVTPPKRETNNNTKDTKEIDTIPTTKEQDSLISCTSGYETKTSDSSEKEQHSLTSLNEQESEVKTEQPSEGKEHDSLTSIGESSGYESFKYKDVDEGFAEELFIKSFVKRDAREYEGEVPLIRSWRASAESIIGPLLASLLKKTAALLESDVIVNCRVTSVVSKLASLPTPLLTSLLLCPGFVLQPNVPSLFQILSKLKEEVDELTEGIENSGELVDKARVFLIQREMALVKTRGQTNDESHGHDTTVAKIDDSPFRRMESKRRSLSNSLSNMFGRRLSSSSPSQNNAHSPQSNSHASPQKRPIFTQDAYWNQSITLRSILNAVILDEWLKELAALCEEHALRLSAGNYEDDSYIHAVAL